MQKVICLIAPTASGKTALAYELYDTGNYYLISVDSALIYRDMNIGTAKPTAEELQRYPHALVDIINPDETYSVAQFVNDVKREIDFAHSINKIPLLVGGTMMYYMALLDGMNDIPATLPETRQQVNAMIVEQGIDNVHHFLRQIDPILGNKLKENDSQRIGRAVEVFLQTGKPLSEWQSLPNQALADNPNQEWQIFAVMPDRAWLHDRIDKRLQIMWQQGFLQEVIDLKQKYVLHADMPSMRCVGYRQAWDFLEQVKLLAKVDLLQDYEKNQQDFQTLVTNLLTKNHDPRIENYRQIMENQALYATRQLAKRQYTWIRKLSLSDKHKFSVLEHIDLVKKLID